MWRAASVLVAVLVGVGLQGCGKEEAKEKCAGNPKCHDCELFLKSHCAFLLQQQKAHGKEGFPDGMKKINEMCQSDQDGLGLSCMRKCPAPDRGDADHRCLGECIRDVNRDVGDPKYFPKLTRFDATICSKSADQHEGVTLTSGVLELSQRAALELPGATASSDKHVDETAQDPATTGPSSETAGKGAGKAPVQDEQKQPSSHEGSKAPVEDEQKQPSSHEGNKGAAEDSKAVEDNKAVVEGSTAEAEAQSDASSAKEQLEAHQEVSTGEEPHPSDVAKAAKTSASRATHLAEIRPTADVDVKPTPSHSESAVSRSSVDALGKVVSS